MNAIIDEPQVPIVIPCEDPILHIPGNPICFDSECPCKEDPSNLALLQDLIAAGVLTEDEATTIVRGSSIENGYTPNHH